jgi:Putative zinc-finger
MTPMMDCSEARLSLGVYVLGAIDPAERAMVDSHLAGCRACRDELSSLAGLPALLARVSPEEAIALAASDPRPAWEEEALEPPDRLVGKVLDLTAARRRRRRWRESIVGVAAALVIAAGVFGGLRMTASPPANPSASGPTYPHGSYGPWQHASGRSDGMTAWVDYRTMTWGTMLEAKVSGIPGGTTCQIWAVGPGKTRVLAGSWTVSDHEGDIWYPASAAIPAGKVVKFVVTVGNNHSITLDS